MDVLAYAPGRGNGHSTRMAAVLRHLDLEVEVLVTDGGTDILDRHELPWRRTDPSAVAAAVRDANPGVFVVDCFPRGIHDELVDVLAERSFGSSLLLWHRLVGRNPVGARAPLAAYDRVLVIEPGDASVGVACDPIVIRDDDELLTREAARVELGVRDDDVAVAVLAPDGVAEELLGWLAGTDVVAVRPDRIPAVELFNGLDGVVGTAGYNLWWEVAACGVPAQWAHRPRAADQTLRVPDPVGPAELVSWAEGLRPRHGAAARYANGARTAAWHISRLHRASSGSDARRPG